ncbi:MAG: NADH-quinone oxidoreductase subunit H [Cytophagales bacterium]|nr:NADH-quinone oxidoreductase subunit H [Cytophagales bacterium]
MSTVFFYLPFVLVFALAGVYAERKVAGFMQDRLGPMEVGKYGILQTLADILKLIQKEDIIASNNDRWLFKLAPLLVFTAIISGFAVLPLTSSWAGSAAETGAFYLLAIISLDIIAILMAGWGSNSKFSLLGAMRSVSQMISYEVPLTLSLLAAAAVAQSLDLQEISYQQGAFWNRFSEAEVHNYLLGIKAWGIDTTEVGGFLTWNVFRSPVLLVAFVIFFIASLAESNRTPFDLPESESELIGGYNTEYSGIRFAFLMLSEYCMMLLVSILAAVLFLGSWNSPLPNIGEARLFDWTTGEPGTVAGGLLSAFWLLSKAFALVFVQMWLRWTLPRLRVDQLMTLGWKYLTPLSLLVLMLSSVWRLLMVIS